MLLWKDTYGPETIPPDPPPPAAAATPNSAIALVDAEPWRRWPRPPGGFVDLGCGNGLLTHILTSEGYAGHGLDLRARTSWTHYPPSTQSRLVVRALDPTTAPTGSTGGAVHLPSPSEQQQQQQQRCRRPRAAHHYHEHDHDDDHLPGPAENEPDDDGDDAAEQHPEHPDDDLLLLLPQGSFLIGNHADELTPWMPLLATRFGASGYLSIPCCAWALDARFDRARDVPLCAVDAATLNLGGASSGGTESDGSGSGIIINSSYALFRVWLAALSVHCGWAVEVEVLRIPSTRNWAIVGEHNSVGDGSFFVFFSSLGLSLRA
jgi:tRNASer (uridine44-2'-O)-methyltransferase